MKPTKILFLDIDGVLNSRRSAEAFNGYPHSFDGRNMGQFDHVAIALVRRLCEKTDCSIVLSSDWRYCHSAHEAANALDLPIIDVTPKITGPRGAEINAWLTANAHVTIFAIVDDVAELEGFSDHPKNFIQTDEMFGLSLKNCTDLARILGVAMTEVMP